MQQTQLSSRLFSSILFCSTTSWYVVPRFRVGPGGEGIKSFNSPIPSQSKLKSARSAQVSSCIQGMLRGGTALEDGVHLYLAAALRHACVKVSSNSCACGRVSWSFFSFFFFLVFGFLFPSESVHLNCLLQVFCFLAMGSTSCWTCSSSSSSSSSCCLDRRLRLLWFRSARSRSLWVFTG